MQGKLLWFLGLWSSSSCSSCPFLCNGAPCSVMEKSGKDGIVASSVTEAWKETITILLADWTAVAGSCLIKYSHSPITFCFKQWHLGASSVTVSETGGLFTACIESHLPLVQDLCIPLFPSQGWSEVLNWPLGSSSAWCASCHQRLAVEFGPGCPNAWKECVKSPPNGLPSVISSCYSPKRFVAWIRACYFFVCWFALSFFFFYNLFVYLENYWVSFRALH